MSGKKMIADRKIIIPAAGFGTRVGSPEAKELLLRPVGCQGAGKPMIEFALDIAAQLQVPAHIITRREKSALLKWLKYSSYSANLETQVVEPTKEWPETLLKSRQFWAEKNLVLLPDVEFTPVDVIEKMFFQLELSDNVWALFDPPKKDFSHWGVIDVKMNRHAEKPIQWAKGIRAWGLFAFRREAGELLLNQLLQSTMDHSWLTLPGTTSFVELGSFFDLTR